MGGDRGSAIQQVRVREANSSLASRCFNRGPESNQRSTLDNV